MSRLTDALEAVSRERLRQEELRKSGKFLWTCASHRHDPGSTVPVSYAEKLVVLMEEIGEVAREVVEWGITTDKYAADPTLMKMPPHREQYFRDRLRNELVQVAACCVAWI